MDTVGALLGVLALAVAGLLGLAWWLGVRAGARRDRPDRGRRDDAVPLDAVLDRLPRAVLVADGTGDVRHASDEATGIGLVRGGLLVHADLRRLVRACLDGPADPPPADLVLARGPVGAGVVHVRVTARRLDAGRVLLDVEDRGEALRVEHVRRDFVVNVSHELKTPVGAIAVLAETLTEAADDPDAVRRFVARIEQEAARLKVLVADVLELSHVQADDGGGRAEDVDLAEVVTDAVDQVRLRAERAHITVSTVAPRDAVVVGDRELLTTAVRNLVLNAIAYSPERTRVSVTVGRRDGLVLVQVTDRGIGIPVAEQQRVFERFYRVDPARSRLTGGTGLGLAIVKHVAENHGGDVTLWSRPGQGSTFTLRLPDPTAPPDPTASPDHPPTRSARSEPTEHPGGRP